MSTSDALEPAQDDRHVTHVRQRLTDPRVMLSTQYPTRGVGTPLGV